MSLATLEDREWRQVNSNGIMMEWIPRRGQRTAICPREGKKRELFAMLHPLEHYSPEEPGAFANSIHAAQP
jgi:hypothetical protein